jgi:hypothetical protein
VELPAISGDQLDRQRTRGARQLTVLPLAGASGHSVVDAAASAPRAVRGNCSRRGLRYSGWSESGPAGRLFRPTRTVASSAAATMSAYRAVRPQVEARATRLHRYIWSATGSGR